MYALNEREAFEAMTRFLDHFLREAGYDMRLLLSDIEVMPDGVTADPAAWHDWIEAVKAVKDATPDGHLA